MSTTPGHQAAVKFQELAKGPIEASVKDNPVEALKASLNIAVINAKFEGAKNVTEVETIKNDAVVVLDGLRPLLEPDGRTVASKMEARRLAENPIAGDINDIITNHPAKQVEIETAAIEAYADKYLSSPIYTRAIWNTELAAGTNINADLKNKIQERINTSVQKEVDDLLADYNKGTIESLDALRTKIDAIQNLEVKDRLNIEFGKIEDRREIFRTTGANLATSVISHALDGMSPPMKGIYIEMIQRAKDLSDAQTRYAEASAAADVATAKSEEVTNLEIFGKKVGNLIKYGGPALLVALLFTGAGVGAGALISNVTLGMLVGGAALGSVGILAGIANYQERGGLKSWRAIDALKSTSNAALQKAEVAAKTKLSKNANSKADYLGFLIEIATRGEAAKTGRILSQEQFDTIKKQIELSTGLGFAKNLNAAAAAAQSATIS